MAPASEECIVSGVNKEANLDVQRVIVLRFNLADFRDARCVKKVAWLCTRNQHNHTPKPLLQFVLILSESMKIFFTFF